MSTLKINTGGGNVLDCIQVVEDVLKKHGDEIDLMCWQFLKPRLTFDREEIARAMHAEVVKENPDLPLMQFETLSGELKAGFRQLADAAIKCMEKKS